MAGIGKGGGWTFCQDLGGFLFGDPFDLLENSARPL